MWHQHDMSQQHNRAFSRFATLSNCLHTRPYHLRQLTGHPQTDIIVIDMSMGVDSLSRFLFPPPLCRSGSFTRRGARRESARGDELASLALFKAATKRRMPRRVQVCPGARVCVSVKQTSSLFLCRSWKTALDQEQPNARSSEDF